MSDNMVIKQLKSKEETLKSEFDSFKACDNKLEDIVREGRFLKGFQEAINVVEKANEKFNIKIKL